MMCAFYGKSDFRLARSVAHLQMDLHTWNSLDDDAKERKFRSFITMTKPRISSNVQISRDRTASCHTPKQAKKPCDNRRIRNAKTTSKPKKKKAKIDDVIAAARNGLLDQYCEENGL